VDDILATGRLVEQAGDVIGPKQDAMGDLVKKMAREADEDDFGTRDVAQRSGRRRHKR